MGNYSLYQYQVILPKTEAVEAFLPEFMYYSGICYSENTTIREEDVDEPKIDPDEQTWLEDRFEYRQCDPAFGPAGLEDDMFDVLMSSLREINEQYVVYLTYTASRSGLPEDADFFDDAKRIAERLQGMFETFNPIVKYNKQSEYSTYFKGNFKRL